MALVPRLEERILPMSESICHTVGDRIAGPNRASAELLDVRAVAELLDASPRHIFRLSDAGKMPPPVRLGALVRWPRQAVRDWIAAGCPAVRSVKGGAR
jgi:predicted DNA-binding transcriptional regulator AlpA